jgi:hypothetical protein
MTGIAAFGDDPVGGQPPTPPGSIWARKKAMQRG